MFDLWVDQYHRLGSEAFPHSDGPAQIGRDRRILELEALVGRLTLENQLLKSAIEQRGICTQEWKGLIPSLLLDYPELSRVRICLHLGISR